jgi:hypothetical protein
MKPAMTLREVSFFISVGGQISVCDYALFDRKSQRISQGTYAKKKAAFTYKNGEC